jgi:hypothetical protein
LATRLHQLKANDLESKGVVERCNGFFETSFMPGRSFDSPADFNDQFGGWLYRANQRVVRTIKARPIDLVDADRAAMLALPPVPPRAAGSTRSVSAATTTCGSTPTTTPSTRPRSAGRSPSSPTYTVSRRASTGGSWPTTPGFGQTHDRHRSHPRVPPTWPSRSGCATSSPPRTLDDQALVRDLADYDRAFGIDRLEVA